MRCPKRRLGRSELKQFTDWNDGQPATELNFKFYRQATNKIVGISQDVAAFLDEFFECPGGLSDPDNSFNPRNCATLQCFLTEVCSNLAQGRNTPILGICLLCLLRQGLVIPSSLTLNPDVSGPRQRGFVFESKRRQFHEYRVRFEG